MSFDVAHPKLKSNLKRRATGLDGVGSRESQLGVVIGLEVSVYILTCEVKHNLTHNVMRVIQSSC